MMGAVRAVLTLLPAVAVLYVMQQNTPGYGEITSPIVIQGKAGERVEGRDFAFAAGNIHLARAVKTQSFGSVREYTTSGVWVLVEGAAVAKRESLTLMSAEWRAPSGVRYALSERFSTLRGYLPTERLEPGLPRPVLLAFEMPEAEVRGGTLLVARSALIPLGEELWIDVGEKNPTDIHPSVALERGSSTMPWILKVE
ncbi:MULTISPECIES: hypothetical protein [unclassified Sinorhizobium]|uniref:hypothetical protein n=1 Tax=unclassified Sinorhizobium TaxID=2613772 RepID=UPI0024C34BA2|nr:MULTISPECIES: hypothetical protein [unclassified Sinorhizobium]MDK1374345.1 hypothetical protein [Sinorhizobium sp. 6-70]MDK1482240.1 hypothetical protein [Sinorhizobium sp. 6-117]